MSTQQSSDTDNKLFLDVLNTPSINERMNKCLVHPISLTTALKWLVNIRDSAERDNFRGASNKEEALVSDMPIIKDYQKYGIPDLPVDSVTGSTKMLNLFIVGCGARANGYLQALLLDYKTGTSPYCVVGIADPISSARSRVLKMAEQAGQTDPIAEYSDWRHVDMDKSQIDIALIMTQDSDHAEPAVAFMSKGCHVIVEKPLGVNSSEMNAMVDAMYKYKRIAAVCTVLEYTSHTQKMKKLISQLGSVEDILIREQVGWHHDAYAYGAGPWSNAKTSSPYTIAKTIHDMSMGLNLIGDKIESMIYMPSNSKANRGKYSSGGEYDPDLIKVYDPYSYLRKYIHKLIREMRSRDDTGQIDMIIKALCEKNANEYVLPIPSYNNVENYRLTPAQIERVAKLYYHFHIYLNTTNYWYNPMLNLEDCDQPSGFTIVSNMASGCQFKMICSPLSAKVCVRHYQIRCEGGELISDFPDISCTKFGVGGENIVVSDTEVPDESQISRRGMHGGADGKFIHTVARAMARAVLTVKELEFYGEEDALAEFTHSHPLNVHFEQNAKLTNAILEATAAPYTLVTTTF